MAAFSPEALLITGGAGFIGSNFVRHMLSTDSDVRIVTLDKLTYAGSRDNLEGLPDAGRHTFVEGDIADPEIVDRLLRDHSIDGIVHFAAESHVDRSISGPQEFMRTNIMGTYVLLEAARARWQKKYGGENCAFRFHHISTDEVYGSLLKDSPAFNETTPYAPNSPYSASKAASDHLVRAWYHTFGLPVVTTNSSNNYGPFQNSEKLIPTVILACIEGKEIPVYGDGSNVRDWLFVTDHCAAIEVVLRHGQVGETYNIGGLNEWANIDIVKTICAQMDERRPDNAPHDRLVSFVTDRPGHDWRYAIDATKIRDALGWKPSESFESGILKTVDWYLERFGK